MGDNRTCQFSGVILRVTILKGSSFGTIPKLLPSGNLLHSHGIDGTFIDGLPIKNGDMVSIIHCVKKLVGGAITILKNMSSSMGRIIPYIMDNKIHVPNHQPGNCLKIGECPNLISKTSLSSKACLILRWHHEAPKLGTKHWGPSYKSPSGSTCFFWVTIQNRWFQSILRLTGWWLTYPSEKYESQIGSSSQLLGKIKNVPNQQTAYCGLHDALSFQQFSRLGFGKYGAQSLFFHFPIEPRGYPPFQDKCEDHNGWVKKTIFILIIILTYTIYSEISLSPLPYGYGEFH